MRLQPPSFGGSTDGVEAEAWLLSLERCFALRSYESNLKVHVAVHLLGGTASTWWRQEEYKCGLVPDTLTWEIFTERFRERYLSEHFRQRRIDEFHDLQQKGLSVTQYESKFFELLPYVDYLKDEKLLVNRFIRGLNAGIAGPVRMSAPESLQVAVEKALIAEEIQVRPQDNRDQFQNRNPAPQTYGFQKPHWKGNNRNSQGFSKPPPPQQTP